MYIYICTVIRTFLFIIMNVLCMQCRRHGGKCNLMLNVPWFPNRAAAERAAYEWIARAAYCTVEQHMSEGAQLRGNG